MPKVACDSPSDVALEFEKSIVSPAAVAISIAAKAEATKIFTLRMHVGDILRHAASCSIAAR